MKIFNTMFVCSWSMLVALANATVQEHAATSSEPTSIKTKTSEGEHTTPAVTFLGKFNGEILRCQRDQCEIFHQSNKNNTSYSLHISGDYIYAGQYNGDILKCNLYKKYSCEIFYSGNSGVWSLTSVRGRLIAGLDDLSNGTIIMCDKHHSNCRPLHQLGSTVTSLTQFNDKIYAGSVGLKVVRCSTTLNLCTQVHGISDGRKFTMGIANIDNMMYLLEQTGVVWKCQGTIICTQVHLNTNDYTWKMAAFNTSVYVLGSMGICDVNTGSCVSYTNQKEIRSVAMAYKTHHMQSQYKNEDCDDAPVTYYNEDARAAFEVHVKNGRLYNANDSLVDTRDADQGHTGPAAIFIMAPEGTIFLAAHHQGIRTSSFLAGNPVSGAGEMVVENGVVNKIMACSKHYKPDLELNKQVVQSLITQGYRGQIVSELCP